MFKDTTLLEKIRDKFVEIASKTPNNFYVDVYIKDEEILHTGSQFIWSMGSNGAQIIPLPDTGNFVYNLSIFEGCTHFLADRVKGTLVEISEKELYKYIQTR